MNFLALYSSECNLKTNTAESNRVAFLSRIHNIQIGKIYSAVVINQGTAQVEVIEYNDLAIKFKIINFEACHEKYQINLIVGATRPQMVKRIYKVAVAYGVRNIIFVNSENTEKSYLSSKYLLDNSEKERIFIEAIEQAGLPFIPEVKIFSRFGLLKDYINNIDSDNCIHIASINCKYPNDSDICVKSKNNYYIHNLIIGPEKGWSEEENLFLDKLTARFYKLSEGVLRVDQAVNSLLALIYFDMKK
jgi:RsmE family RNA methyltransferase